MRVTEYVGIQVLGKVGETDLVFGQRLTLLWTEILRKFPAEFDLVYAETIAFEKQEEKPTRRYAIEAEGVGFSWGKFPWRDLRLPHRPRTIFTLNMNSQPRNGGKSNIKTGIGLSPVS